jgi:hypothetical protein
VVEPPRDRASSEPERDELRVRDEAVLALRELPDRPVHGARCLFCIYAMQKWLLAAHPPIVTARVYRRTRGMRRNRLGSDGREGANYPLGSGEPARKTHHRSIDSPASVTLPTRMMSSTLVWRAGSRSPRIERIHGSWIRTWPSESVTR